MRARSSPRREHPQPLHQLAPGLALARGGPGRNLNVYLLGSVVVDSGVRWSRRRLARQLAGRQITAYVLTHAHFDHAGCSAWLCHTLGVPLWCGAGDANAIGSGRVDIHRSQLVNRLQRTLAPVAAHPVSRSLQEGDVVAGFEVLEVPGTLARGAGVLARRGPGADLRRRGGQRRPAPQPSVAGVGAGGTDGRFHPHEEASGFAAHGAAPLDQTRRRVVEAMAGYRRPWWVAGGWPWT
jgi:Metallo-beta-lactamase superfamily